jgi:hypothetical protein
VAYVVAATRTVAPARVPTESLLDGFGVAVEPSGVVIGRDSAAAPVLVRIFGPEPTNVTFIGGWWAAQVLTYRCLAHGAMVLVDAPAVAAGEGSMATLAQWVALDRATGTADGRVRPMFGSALPNWPSSAIQPLLRLYDSGPGGPSGRVPLQAWQTQLTVLSQVTPASLPAVTGADLVLVQRLDPPEASLLGSALLLGQDFVDRFGAMDNEMVAAFRGPAVRYAWLNPTAVERQLFG